MSDWTDGYLTDVEYSYIYNTELNPLKARLALLSTGLSVPHIGTACELGFGQGLSINVHAAASRTEWWGTDFNPTQVGFARELGAASGADVRLFDEAFADFVHRRDLPDFDFIGMHGIWSWISTDNQALLIDFIRRKLKVRGILYNGYNLIAGWASFAPIRHLMAEHAALAGAAGGGKLNVLKGTLDFVEKFLATNPGVRRISPNIVDRFGNLKKMDPLYLVHEFLNGHWQPSSFASMTEALAPARVSFACSANFLDHYDAVNFSADQRAFMQALPDATFRQSVRDLMVNQSFRRDYWVKGPGQLTALQQLEALSAERVVLVSHRSDVELKFTTALGEAVLYAPVYDPLLDLLADHQPKTIGEVARAMQARGVGFKQVVEALVMLAGKGHVMSAQDETVIAQVGVSVRRLNDGLLDRARSSGNTKVLASPVTGGGINVTRAVQNFLLAHRAGCNSPAELADSVWRLLESQGQRVIKGEMALEAAEANIAELALQASKFLEQRLPVLKALQIA